jgi:hypothetical protein
MGGSESESRVSAVGSDPSSMLSPELVERSSRKKNVIANQYERTPSGGEVTPRSGLMNIRIRIEHPTEIVAPTKQI